MSVDFPAPPSTRGVLMAIGGAEDKMKARRILNAFLTRAGGDQARIAVIPAASTQPGRVGELYHALFRDLGAADVEVLQIDARSEAQDAGRVAVLDQATAIFLTGGNQLRLTTLLGGTAIAQTIRRRNNEGILVAGTSAGGLLPVPTHDRLWQTRRMAYTAHGAIDARSRADQSRRHRSALSTARPHWSPDGGRGLQSVYYWSWRR